jgi:dihydroxy-acid dehydratase
LVKDGDRIIIDAEKKSIDWVVDEGTKRKRQEEWDKTAPRPLRERRGVLFRYARDVAVSELFYSWYTFSPKTP